MAVSELPPACGLAPIHEYVEAFEQARARQPDIPLSQFVPAAEHPLRAQVLHELIRIDLEHGWARGRPRSLSDYQSSYSDAFDDPACVQELAFEEYRQRLQAGNHPDPAEYAERFGINTTDWPSTVGSSVQPHEVHTERLDPIEARQVEEAARAFRSRQLQLESRDGRSAACDLFEELNEADPSEAERVAEAVTSLPEVGDRFGDFELLGELGRGAFGRVFLARQLDLAGRCVALKVSAEPLGEPQALAQLLHNNVMPIYTCQRVGPFEAICMPFLGATTLADVLQEIRGRGNLPASGKGLVSTLQDMGSGKLRSTLDSLSEATSHASESDQPAPPVLHKATSRFALDVLEHYNYVDAVLWLGSRLADGLAHAHEHGILHRDLKPANVLISDEGQPILLDFNLAEDTKLRQNPAAARVGGTLPYMAPEQLYGLGGAKTKTDERSDVFSLGVIFCELLTGRHPYPLPPGRTRDILPTLIEERLKPPLPLRRFNREVTPAAEAIVLKCLAADPAQRYQSARALHEDLERHLAHLPLRHVTEPSRRERLQKWARRHPRLSSSTSIGMFATVLVFLLAGALGLTLSAVYKSKALAKARTFADEAAETQMELTQRPEDSAQLQRVLDRGAAALGRYGFAEQQPWEQSADYRWLPAEAQERLRGEAGALLFAMSRAAWYSAAPEPGPERMERLEAALQFNALALAAFAPSEAPRALLVQRGQICRDLGRDELAKTLREEFQRRRDIGTLDQVLTAREWVVQGRYREAFPILRDVTQREPGDLLAWFLLARCCDEFGDDRSAVLAYGACLALQPHSQRLYFNRGLAYLRQQDWRRAWHDFDQAIQLDASNPDAWFNRALAAHHQGDQRAAIADFTRSLELGAPSTRVCFMRARSYEKLGDAAAAQRDREQGLSQAPTDARSWNARGEAQLNTAPEKALADFEQALRLYPRNRPALENQAHVLAERLGRTAEAIKVLDRLVQEYPELVPHRSSRGVLQARLGNRDAALQDAEDALRRNSNPNIQYQVAGIFALTSKTHPEDARQAFHLLFSALRRGYGLDLLDTDPDLDPIRPRPEFARLLEAARTLRQQPGGPQASP